jgi:hypothetical protein
MATRPKRPNPSRGWPGPADIVAGRITGAGLLAWMAWIHLHLWIDGYRHLHVVGDLFLANFVIGVGAALAVASAPRRMLPIAASAGAVLALGTLGALAISLNIGLFGFKDSLEAPFVYSSIWAESSGAVALVALAVRSGVWAYRSERGPARPGSAREGPRPAGGA